MGKKGSASKSLVVPSSSLKNREDGSDLESVQSVGEYQSLDDEDQFDASTTVGAFDAHITAALDKDNNARFSAIEQLIRVFRYAYMPELAAKHGAALFDVVEKALRRTPDEAERALRLASVLTLQLGLDAETSLAAPLNAMCALLTDASNPEALRTACAEVLGLCTYFGVYRAPTRAACLQSLRQTWSTMKLSMTQQRLFSMSLLAWCLVLERNESVQIEEAINDVQSRLSWYLESNSPDARLAAGEALAVLYELGVDNADEEFRFANHHQLRTTFDEMAADSVKYHAKRDKRSQKFTIRQVVDAIFNGNPPTTTVRFNKRETLELEGCHSRLLYDMLCHVLKGDINSHLARNDVLRGLFDLGDPLGSEEPVAGQSKAQKTEQRAQQVATSKDRKIRRGKQRDKRDKAFSAED